MSKIILVDQDRALAEAVEEHFKGVEIVSCGKGEASSHASGAAVALVGSDGLQAGGELKKAGASLIVITDATDDALLSQALGSGASYIFPSSTPQDFLFGRIGTLL